MKDFASKWNNLRKYPNSQLSLVKDTFAKYKFDINISRPMTEAILREIQSVIKKEFKIYVLQRPDIVPCRKFQPMFEGESNSKLSIFLEFIGGSDFNDGHFNVITSITGYLNVKEVCLNCCIGSTNSRKHFCEAVCRSCARKDCVPEEEFECDICTMKCRSESCLDTHLEKMCAKLTYCEMCEVRYKPVQGYQHRCDYRYCSQCEMEYGSNHHHFIPPLDKTKLMEQDQKKKITIAYDIEAAQVKLDDRYSEHRANLLISHTVCDECWNWETMASSPCSKCGPMERIFQGESCVEAFCDYLLEEVTVQAGKDALVDIYAHNAKAYDSRFILRELLTSKLKRHELIMTGTKITKMQVGNLRFLDSCLHFQQKLSKLPSSFNFADRVVKGHFPHFFNDGTTWNYEGPIPEAKYFGVDTMQADDKKSFESWYAERSADPTPWNFEEEIVKYCRNDVEVLLLAVQKYRRQAIDETNIDPTTRKFTLAGVAHETFRACMLKKEAIGITPIAGYSTRNCSMSGKAWLDGEEVRIGRKIEREVALGPYYADGFDRQTGTVYEFWGCLWHGCECKYLTEDQTFEIGGKTLNGVQLRAKVQEKLAYYRRRKFGIIEIKECEFLDKLYPRSRGVPEEDQETEYEMYRITNFVRSRIQHYKNVKSKNLFCNLKIVGEHDTGLDSFIINYICVDDADCSPGNTSIAIASFVTAYARLKLYDLIETVENDLPKLKYRPRTLYFDTDSIIYIAHKHDPENQDSPVRTGDYLGQLTDEIKGDYGESAICKRAAFLGPKNYAYEISFTDKPDKKNVVKCKGITLYSSDLNAFKEFETVINMAKTAHEQRQHQGMTFQQFGIRANGDTHVLNTITFEKTISSNMNKRRYLPELGWSVPLGYQLDQLSDEARDTFLAQNGNGWYGHYALYMNYDRNFHRHDDVTQENAFVNVG
ncbi:putative DNA polymerase [Halotydeus destructor]|nr:putative DNA polymerase [Halotydeus destructor]